MASKAIDSFSRPDGPLGKTDTGQTWSKFLGIETMVIKNGRAYVPKTGIGTGYCIDTGLGGGDGTIDINFLSNDGGGQALYFRVLDANRWWRLYKRHSVSTSTYSYVSGYTPETFGWVGNGTYRYEPAGAFQYRGTAPSDGRPAGDYYEAFDSRVGVYLSYSRIYRHADGRMVQDHYYVRTVYENQSYVKTGGGDPIYSTGTSTQTNVEMRLERQVNGAVQLIKSAPVANDVSSLGVVLDGPKITAYSNKGIPWGTVEDSLYQTSPRHGIGYSSGTSTGNVHGIESFSAVPFILTGYAPPLML